jgi:hypothetical protein
VFEQIRCYSVHFFAQKHLLKSKQRIEKPHIPPFTFGLLIIECDICTSFHAIYATHVKQNSAIS